MKEGKLFVLGLDAFPFHLIKPVIENGVMKNFISLLRDSFLGCNICIPPYTPPSWVSIETGIKWENKRGNIMKYYAPAGHPV